MATKTIIPGCLYITTGTVSGDTITHDANKCVEVWSAKIDYSFENAVVMITIPVSKGNRGSTTPYTRAVDLKRIKKAITVQGQLADDSAESANTKKNNLESMAENDGALTMVWGIGNYQTLWEPTTAPYGVFILKIMWTETTGIYGEAVAGDPQPFRKMDIQFNVIRGKDI